MSAGGAQDAPKSAADIAQLRDAVVASLAAKIPNVRIDAHGGTFDLPEIKRYAAIAPAIVISVVGCGKGYRWNDGRWAVPVNFAAIVVAIDRTAGDRKSIVQRDTAAMMLATAVELAVQANRFGLEGVLQPQNLTARNEYSGAVDNAGVALWQVNWTSDVLLGEKAQDSIDAIVQMLAIEPPGAPTQIYPPDPDLGGGA